MNREIKFRAWDKQNKKMRYNVGISFSDCGQHIEIEKMMLNPDNLPTTFPTSAFILMQYTGLKDRTGKEVYEGDILKHSAGFIGIVIWWVDRFWSERISDKAKHPIRYPELIEVIGTVYENPELLKENK